jgi:hypothetical protein
MDRADWTERRDRTYRADRTHRNPGISHDRTDRADG